VAGATAIPRPFHVTKHTHASKRTQIRKSNQPGDTSENLELAPVLATSKLLGVMENNEETRQKRLARQKRLTYQSNPGGGGGGVASRLGWAWTWLLRKRWLAPIKAASLLRYLCLNKQNFKTNNNSYY
jgi:hypothetical protein